MQSGYKTIPSAFIKATPSQAKNPSWEPGKSHQSLTARLIRKGFRPVTHKHCNGQGCFLCQNVGIVWVNPITGAGAIVEYDKQGFLIDAVI